MVTHHHPRVRIPPEEDVREFNLRRGIIHTEISPRLARGLIGLFLLIICGVPLSQFFQPDRWEVWELFETIPTRASLHHYETTLETTSAPRTFVQPYLQLAASAWGGFGNVNAVIGRGGWLFYAPGIEYVTGRGFLDPNRLKWRWKERIDAGDAAFHPDPRPAIKEFAALCRQYGARLVLLPVPDKAMLQPAQLSGRVTLPGATPNNPDFGRFVAEMQAAGIEVFDATPTTLTAGDVRFLQQDTHWTPDWMDAVSRALAARLGPTAPPTATLEPVAVTRVGDLVDMLKLPAHQQLFLPQTITVQRVLDSGTRQSWQPSHDADILVLGDSFTNVFSAEVMGWGDSAGFVEHLSYHLGKPVDRITRNDNGASATRQILAEEMARGNDRLKGKRVVVWEFAIRELMVGDWKPITYRLDQPAPRQFFVPSAGQTVQVSGRIVAIAPAPRPGTVPYKDHIIALHLTDLPGGRDALVYVWSMRNNVWTPAARWQPGQQVTLKLRAWSDVEAKYEAINRAELSDENLLSAEPCWSE